MLSVLGDAILGGTSSNLLTITAKVIGDITFASTEISDYHNILTSKPETSDTAGDSLYIESAWANGNASGGALELSAGSVESGYNGDGGYVFIGGGWGRGLGVGGDATLFGGNSDSPSNSGNAILQGGFSGMHGGAIITAGGGRGDSLAGGSATILGGDSELGGSISISGGQGESGAGGGVQIFSGNSTSSTAGVINLQVGSGTGTGLLVINNANTNADFVVKGVADSALLFLDASTNQIGIGTSSPTEKLHINGGFRQSNGSFNILANNASNIGTNLGLLHITATGELYLPTIHQDD